MNVPQSDTEGAEVNFIVDGDTHFVRTIVYKRDGVAFDTTYWDVEMVVFYPQNCKQILVWNNTNGAITYVGTGEYFIDELIDVAGDEIDKGDYEYYFLMIDPDGIRSKPFKGKFVVK